MLSALPAPPLAIHDGRGRFVSRAIRDPETEEIVDRALTSQQLAEKAGIELEQARRITSTSSVQVFRPRGMWPRCAWWGGMGRR